jgi:hypothetical protein
MPPQATRVVPAGKIDGLHRLIFPVLMCRPCRAIFRLP